MLLYELKELNKHSKSTKLNYILQFLVIYSDVYINHNKTCVNKVISKSPHKHSPARRKLFHL